MTGPEMIWIEDGEDCPYFYHESELDDVSGPIVGYIRADLHDEMVEALRDALEDAEYDLLQWLECSAELVKAGFNMDGIADVARRVRAALARTIHPIDTTKQTD